MAVTQHAADSAQPTLSADSVEDVFGRPLSAVSANSEPNRLRSSSIRRSSGGGSPETADFDSGAQDFWTSNAAGPSSAQSRFAMTETSDNSASQASAETISKRTLQNRKAQREFRQRRAAYLKDLEEKVRRYDGQAESNIGLQRQIIQLREENDYLRTQLARYQAMPSAVPSYGSYQPAAYPPRQAYYHESVGQPQSPAVSPVSPAIPTSYAGPVHPRSKIDSRHSPQSHFEQLAPLHSILPHAYNQHQHQYQHQPHPSEVEYARAPSHAVNPRPLQQSSPPSWQQGREGESGLQKILATPARSMWELNHGQNPPQHPLQHAPPRTQHQPSSAADEHLFARQSLDDGRRTEE